jgi:UDP-glucose 4-epimerase
VRVLVTGGAGYIGSITADELLGAGHSVVVLDNLTQRHRDAVPREGSSSKGTCETSTRWPASSSGSEAWMGISLTVDRDRSS